MNIINENEDTIEIVKKYYKNGNIHKKLSYKNGKRHGDCFTYYNTGELKTHTKWIADKMVGYQYNYYKNGKIKIKTKYKNGLEHGTRRVYHSNGMLKFHVPVKNNKVLTGVVQINTDYGHVMAVVKKLPNNMIIISDITTYL